MAPAPRERVLPSGTIDIVVNLAEDNLHVFDGAHDASPLRFPGIMIFGAHAGYFVVGTAPRASVMGVHFKPGGAFPFLNVPAGDLEGTHAALDELWGPSAVELRERLIEAPSTAERFSVLDAFLRARLAMQQAARSSKRCEAVALAVRAFDDPSLRRVTEVNERTGLSPKRLISIFRDEVGLRPKAFWRVRRFQAALQRIEHARIARVQPTALRIRGAELAAELGYCDQAHFNREFHAFTGLSPSAYLAQGVERPNQVPMRG